MSSGFSYPQPIFKSTIYNPEFYLSLDASGFLTYDYAQTLYLGRNDYRLTYLTGITAGTATQGVALVPGDNKDIAGIGAFSCSSLTVNWSAITSAPGYVLGITGGTGQNLKALVLSSTGSITSGIVSLTLTGALAVNTLTGTLSTAAQTNITSVGTLTGLTIGGNLTFTGASRTLTGLESLSSTNLTGTLQTASLSNITSVGTLTNLTLDMAGTGLNIPSLKFNGTTFNQDYYINITEGAAGISQAVVLNSTKDFNGIRDLTCSGAVTGSTGVSTPSLTCDTITKTGTQNMTSTTLNINPTTLQLWGTTISATATQLNYNQITTLGTFQSSRTMTLDANGMGVMGLGSVASNCIRFYGGTANKEMISIYRDNDDGGLIIATKAQTIQKLSPLLTLNSGIDQTGVSGTSSAEYKEIIRANNKLVGFTTNYQSGWFNGYLLGTQSWGGNEGTQFYTSANTLNLVANSSSTSSFTSGCNLLLTSVSSINRLIFNSTTPYSNGAYGSASITLNNGNMYIKCSISFNDGSTSYDMPIFCESSNASSPINFGIQLHNGASSTSTNGAYFGTLSNNDFILMTNNTRRLTILGGTNAGRVGVGTASPTAGLQVAINVSQSIDSSGNGVAYFLKSGGLVSTIGPISSVAVAIQATGAILASAGFILPQMQEERISLIRLIILR